MRRHALRDDQWDRMKDLLPGSEGWVGAKPLTTGCSWMRFCTATVPASLASSAGSIRQTDSGPYAFLALGQIRRLGAGVPASRSGPRQ